MPWRERAQRYDARLLAGSNFRLFYVRIANHQLKIIQGVGTGQEKRSSMRIPVLIGLENWVAWLGEETLANPATLLKPLQTRRYGASLSRHRLIDGPLSPRSVRSG